MTEIQDHPNPPVRRNPVAALVRLALHVVLKIIVVAFMVVRLVLRPRAVRYGLALLAILGIVAWNVAPSSLKAQVGPATAPATTGEVLSAPPARPLPQAPIVERYLKAQADYDAAGMWATISDSLKRQIQSSSGNLEQLQAELDTAKKQGRKYKSAAYIGGAPMSADRSVYFYVLTVDTPAGPTEIPYIYVVGPDGKIVSIQ